jgi:hypothetical protein
MAFELPIDYLGSDGAMNRIHPHSAGLVLSIFLAAWHTCWVVLVWFGGAQTLIDFVFRLHMITPPYRIAAFSFGAAVSLIVITAGIGYVLGFVISILWNSYGPPAHPTK